jgi:N-acetyl-gamma-glutamyl-phosphate reductase
VAVPGCYPTACSLALAPGFAAGLLEPGDVVIVAASGTSGAGRSLKPHLLGAEVMGSMSPYGVGGSHRHTPEIEQNLSRSAGRPVTVSFTPTLAPMPRGILATCTARVTPGTTPAAVRAAWDRAYVDELFVHVLPEGQWPRTGDVAGSNVVQVQVALDERTGRVVAVASVDNLTKGTAGAAVQCANLALGLPEATGLPTVGVAP